MLILKTNFHVVHHIAYCWLVTKPHKCNSVNMVKQKLSHFFFIFYLFIYLLIYLFYLFIYYFFFLGGGRDLSLPNLKLNHILSSLKGCNACYCDTFNFMGLCH